MTKSDEENQRSYGRPERRRCCDSTPKKIAWGVSTVALVLLFIILLATSLRKLKSTELGVKYNVHKKELDDAARTGGLHSGTPGFKFVKFPSTFITVDLPQDTCVSRDGLNVRYEVTFQYQMPANWILPAINKYRNYDRWADMVEAAGTAAIHHTCSEFIISNFQNKRGVIQGRMEENLRVKLEGTSEDGSDGVYAKAISLQLRNVNVPQEYENAVAEKQAATEDIELAKNQREQETTKAGTTLLAAQEEAKKIDDTAVNDADILLTEANTQAEGILFAFETEASTLVQVKSALKLDTDGLLAYLSNNLVASADQLSVQAQEPASLSRKVIIS